MQEALFILSILKITSVAGAAPATLAWVASGIMFSRWTEMSSPIHKDLKEQEAVMASAKTYDEWLAACAKADWLQGRFVLESRSRSDLSSVLIRWICIAFLGAPLQAQQWYTSLLFLNSLKQWIQGAKIPHKKDAPVFIYEISSIYLEKLQYLLMLVQSHSLWDALHNHWRQV